MFIYTTETKFRISRDSTCNTKNVIYLASCKKCYKQGVGSCIEWKTRLINFKSHIKNNDATCMIVKHFIDECCDSNDTFRYLNFSIIDVLNNVEYFSQNDIESLLLQKENVWIGSLVTQHKGLNRSNDWNRRNRIHKQN